MKDGELVILPQEQIYTKVNITHFFFNNIMIEYYYMLNKTILLDNMIEYYYMLNKTILLDIMIEHYYMLNKTILLDHRCLELIFRSRELRHVLYDERAACMACKSCN